MKIRTGLLIPVLVLGLVGMAEGNRAAIARNATNAGSPVVQALLSAHNLLIEADHDYKGHRALAAHRVHMALKELGTTAPVAPKKSAARSGKSTEHEPQAASDAKLRQAQQILQGIAGQVKKREAAAHVNGAIKEINDALSVR